MLQPSSGIETEGNDTHDINGVAVSHGNNEIFQRGPMPREENVSQANSGAATDWVLQEQVKSKPNDMSISSVAESTGVVAWQPSANQSLNAGTAWSTSQNLYLSSGEKAPPSSNSSWEASRKQEYAASSVSCSGDAIGNINKGCNPVNANRGSQRRHHRDRYSQISESWLLSSNHTRSRSDRFGCGGSSRSTSKGQTRGVCKFHESGHCRKGASCSYLHP
uniref:C3H1-type domain-containing protein n=1 Tax=Arundo donax TaxID=35708 RepID=A0A0A9G7R5_ARUDO